MAVSHYVGEGGTHSGVSCGLWQGAVGLKCWQWYVIYSAVALGFGRRVVGLCYFGIECGGGHGMIPTIVP
jgi:hypothetical protein